MKNHVSAMLVFLALTAGAFAQSTAQYEVRLWGQPPNNEWSSGTVSVASDHKGSILVLRRSDPPILVFTPEGKLLRSWGDGLFKRAHSIDVDRNGFVWVTDSDLNVVYKFSMDGKLLMTLGRKGVTGDNNSHDAFNGPSDVITAPNGDIFVSDGDHNNRIVKFTKDGKFIRIIGGKGKTPGLFAPASDDAKPTEGLVHAIAWDSKGRIVTVESYNPRIQFFDQDGKFLEQWIIPSFIKPCGLYVAPDDTIYVSDTEAGMIFLVKDGKVVETIRDPGGRPHNMDVDAAGAIYTADNTNKIVKKIVKKSPAATSACEGLSSLSLANTTVTSARIVAEKDLPDSCRVALTLKPTKDSDIKVEVWLPASNWNGKFQAVGNGGWAGTINYADMTAALRRGYATSSTDTGHTGEGGSFALNWEKYVDYSYRSEHEMTLKAKAIINKLYGRAPQYSYWNGCSTGGRQGLMEAQRFPNDYDGIIAGSSANPKSYLNAWALSAAQMVSRNPASYIPATKYPMIHRAVINTCDEIDGLKDGLIEDPRLCRFDARMLTCNGQDGATCLTAPQAELARNMMAPLKKRDGTLIFPGHNPGTELGWNIVFPGPDAPSSIAADQYKYTVYKDEKWDWRTFDPEKDVALSDKVEKGTINAVNPDLKAFSSHGGKLLMYHGWNDPNVAAQSSINYYESVAKTMGGETKTSNWLRLFLAPGMGHCRGGEGPNTFDAVTALEQWVEQGKPPVQIIASHSTNGQVDRTRPLCPYPQIARYKGTGNTDDAANFVCRVP